MTLFAGALVNALVFFRSIWPNTVVMTVRVSPQKLPTTSSRQQFKSNGTDGAEQLSILHIYAKPRKMNIPLAHGFPHAAVGRLGHHSANDLLKALLSFPPQQQNLTIASNPEDNVPVAWTVGNSTAPQTQQQPSTVMPDVHFNSCAIVASSGGLVGSGLGDFIDSHDAVVRFNDAPIPPSLAKDIGNRTTVRFLNNVVMRNLYLYLKRLPSIFDSPYVVGWDACSEQGPLAECTVSAKQMGKKHGRHVLERSVLRSWESYMERRSLHPKQHFYFLDPMYVWSLWNFLQQVSPYPIPPNPPSTGFIGAGVMLHKCSMISLIELVPSPRALKRPCYYYHHIPMPIHTLDLKPVSLEIPRDKQAPCKVPLPGTGWHPRHMEKAVLLRMSGLQPDKLDSYEGILRLHTQH